MLFEQCITVGLMLAMPDKVTVHYVSVPYGNVAFLPLAVELARLAHTEVGEVQSVAYARSLKPAPVCRPRTLLARLSRGVW